MRNTRNAYQDERRVAYREATVRAVDKIMRLDVRGLVEAINIMVREAVMLMVIHEIIYSCENWTHPLSAKGFCAPYTRL